MTMITPSYLGETIEYSSLHACRSTLEDPTFGDPFVGVPVVIAGQPDVIPAERSDVSERCGSAVLSVRNGPFLEVTPSRAASR